MTVTRRRALVAGIASVVGATGTAVHAQAYPASPIRFLIPTAPGGGHDIMMRLIGQKLTESLGQPCIVESRPGGSGVVAAQAAIQAQPDGYTFVLGYSAFLSNTVLMPKSPYRLEDLAPISMLALTPIALGISESLGATTLQQYVAIAKARAGKLSYGSYGQGSGGHFVGELFNMAASLDILHVPYKGEAPALQDVLAGQVQSAFTSVGGASRFPGRIRPLAVATAERSPSYPNVPTFAEQGYPDVDMPGWGALFAPARTPQPIIDRMTAEMNRIVLLPDVKARLAELGFDSVGWAPPRINQFFREQLTRTRALVESGRVKL